MSRQLCITSVDGHTGFLIAELILTDNKFKKAIGTVTGLTLHPDAPFCKELSKLGAKIVPHKPGRLRDMVSSFQEVGADTMCLIPPAHTEKFDITAELIEATKKANVPNVCFLSSAGCDLAERDKQPRLREFIDLEARFMASKGDPSTSTGHSPVIIRCVVKSWLLILSYPGWPSVQLTYQSVEPAFTPKIYCSTLGKHRKKAYFLFPLGKIISSHQ